LSINGSPQDDTAVGREPDVLFCANHPSVPTSLRCSRCGKPICARCRVATPVGYRCYECADVQSVPTYAVDTNYYVKALAVGVGAAAGIGVLWGLFPGFDFWAALIMGIVVGEAVSWAANMKRGPGLQMVGVVAVALGIVVSRLVLQVVLSNAGLYGLLAAIPGNEIPNTLFNFRDLAGLLFYVLPFGLVFYRLR
jgi:hypothetical protein